MMNALVDKIMNECATAYSNAKYYDNQMRDLAEIVGRAHTPFKTIGCTLEESDTLFYLCCYIKDHYSRYNPFLPRDFKGLMYNGSGRQIGKFEINQLFLLHYKVDLGAMNKKARKIERSMQNLRLTQDFDAEKWMTSFNEKYGRATVIWPEFTGIGKRLDLNIPYIIGRREVQQEVMSFLKESPNNIFDVLKAIAGSAKEIEFVNKNTKQIHILDIVGKPRETHFRLQ